MAAIMTPAAAALRAEFETHMPDALDKVGPTGLTKASAVNPFMGRGAGRTTLYRWYDGIMASGRPGQHKLKVVRATTAARVAIMWISNTRRGIARVLA